MTLRFSDGLRNFIQMHGSMRDALRNGQIEVYSGSQPADGNQATSGTKLITFTNNGGSRTAEVLATGTVTLNSGSSGSVDGITVNSIQLLDASVPYNTSLTQTAADVAAAINQSITQPEYTASSSGAVVTIKAKPGSGTTPNGFTVASTVTTLTKTDVNMSGGVAAVNGLRMGIAAGGVLGKIAADVWQGTGVANGTAGWFRFKGSVVDGDALDSAATFIRLDGSAGTSGTELILTSTSIAISAVETVTSFALTQPAQ